MMSELNFWETAEDNLYLLFYDALYVSCTFCKFETCLTSDLYSLLSVRWILNFSESAENNSYFLLYNDIYVSCNIL